MDTAQRSPSQTSNNIATNNHGVRYATGLTDRVAFEKVYLRRTGGTGGGRSLAKYDPKSDAPVEPMSLTSTKAEQQSQANTEEILVVGLILAQEPDRHTIVHRGSYRNKADEDARKILGVQEDAHYLRAVVAVQDSVAVQAKYYVACHRTKGVCAQRLIAADQVYYYSEFYNGSEAISNLKARRAHLNKTCREAAARLPVPVSSGAAVGESGRADDISTDDEELWTTCKREQSVVEITEARQVHTEESTGSEAFIAWEQPFGCEEAWGVSMHLMELNPKCFKQLSVARVEEVRAMLHNNEELQIQLRVRRILSFLNMFCKRCVPGVNHEVGLAKAEEILAYLADDDEARLA
ncbi:hypothetical protein LTR95_002645 [Oleoguttula sp. CCFEE 5521]